MGTACCCVRNGDAPAATLTDDAGADDDRLGAGLALSADGSTLVTGTSNDEAVLGYTRPAGGWVSSDTATQFSLPNGSEVDDGFGDAVALSADGRTLAVGAPRSYLLGGTKSGSVYVYRNFLTNANLSGLSLSQGTLSPAFAADISSYTATVASGVSSITVTPTLADTNASVTVNGAPVTSGSASGAISLKGGTNVITVIVTAEDGTTRTTTTITVTRLYGVWLPVIVR